jgi:hypothetical protein
MSINYEGLQVISPLIPVSLILWSADIFINTLVTNNINLLFLLEWRSNIPNPHKIKN